MSYNTSTTMGIEGVTQCFIIRVNANYKLSILLVRKRQVYEKQGKD